MEEEQIVNPSFDTTIEEMDILYYSTFTDDEEIFCKNINQRPVLLPQKIEESKEEVKERMVSLNVDLYYFKIKIELKY